MAVSVTQVSPSAAQTSGRDADVWGRRRIGLYRVTMDNSYATGGESFDPVQFGFQGPVAAVILSVRSSATTPTRRFEYDYAAKKIIGFVTSTGAEIAAAQDLSLIAFDVIVIGE